MFVFKLNVRKYFPRAGTHSHNRAVCVVNGCEEGLGCIRRITPIRRELQNAAK